MSYLTLNEGAAPSTPSNGKGVHYDSTVGEPHFLNDSGADMNLTPNRKYNWLRNSGFWFAQRQNPTSLATYNATNVRQICADGWSVNAENASSQYIRTDTAGAFETGLVGRYYGNFTKITSNGKLMICQVLEGTDSQNLRGRTVRVQFWAKSIVTASQIFRVGLIQSTNVTLDTVPSLAGTFITAYGASGTDPTLGTSLAYTAPKASVSGDNCTVNGNAADCTITTVWQRFSAVFDVATTVKNLIPAIWSNSQVATTAGIAISQVSLTDGYEIQEWSPQTYAVEMQRVQRFYCKSFAIDTAPSQNAAVTGAVRGTVSVAGISAGQPLTIRFPVPMSRSSQLTTTLYNPSAANAFVRNTTAGTDATASAGGTGNDSQCDAAFTGIAAWTVGQIVAVHYSTDGEL